MIDPSNKVETMKFTIRNVSFYESLLVTLGPTYDTKSTYHFIPPNHSVTVFYVELICFYVWSLDKSICKLIWSGENYIDGKTILINPDNNNFCMIDNYIEEVKTLIDINNGGFVNNRLLIKEDNKNIYKSIGEDVSLGRFLIKTGITLCFFGIVLFIVYIVSVFSGVLIDVK